MNAVITPHKLDFEVAEWPHHPTIKVFRIGTCNGQFFWMIKKEIKVLCLLCVVNDEPGNGHLDDVFCWFEESARKAKCPLMIMDFFNPDFKRHCIEKRGYREVPQTDHLIKFL